MRNYNEQLATKEIFKNNRTCFNASCYKLLITKLNFTMNIMLDKKLLCNHLKYCLVFAHFSKMLKNCRRWV